MTTDGIIATSVDYYMAHTSHTFPPSSKTCLGLEGLSLGCGAVFEAEDLRMYVDSWKKNAIKEPFMHVVS